MPEKAKPPLPRDRSVTVKETGWQGSSPAGSPPEGTPCFRHAPCPRQVFLPPENSLEPDNLASDRHGHAPPPPTRTVNFIPLTLESD